MSSNLCALNSRSLSQAEALLRQGGVVAFPTETVYGLAADGGNNSAVAKIFAAKNRPHFNPLIAHFANFDHAVTQVTFSAKAQQLAEHFWPGALTIITHLRPDSRMSALACDGGKTMAVRVPALLPSLTSLLSRFDCGLVAPSANPSGQLSPTSAHHVAASLGPRIDMILDGGACPIGIESTIVDLTTSSPKLLRHGGIPQETLEPHLGPLKFELTPERIKAPGQLKNHYSPQKNLVLNQTQPPILGEGRLGFGSCQDCTLNLSPHGDLTEAAANLFDFLNRLDCDPSIRIIGVSPIPNFGLGAALNDRLARGATAQKTRG